MVLNVYFEGLREPTTKCLNDMAWDACFSISSRTTCTKGLSCNIVGKKWNELSYEPSASGNGAVCMYPKFWIQRESGVARL
jgi:hypothetical protein